MACGSYVFQVFRTEKTVVKKSKELAPRPGTFMKGNKSAVGNVGPRGRPITQVLIAQLNELETIVRKVDGKKLQITKSKMHHLVDMIIRRAIHDENLEAAKMILDRVDGKPIQAIEGTGENGAVVIRIETEDQDV